MYDERLGKLHFWLTFVAFNVTFFPQHYIGLRGMPRRVADYSDEFHDWNMVSTIGAFALGASTLIFFYNIVRSWRFGERVGHNPWRAMTIEWQVSSPPSKFNFDEIPQVVGGPYEYGVPGARHAVFNGARAPVGQPEKAATH
jgi:cytochrome c oxidase subunit 1